MQQYAMLIIGAIVLAAGIYMKDKRVANVSQERGIALATYAGWVLFFIPLSKLTTPIFANMPGNWPNTGVLVFQAIMFIVGAELFLKNAFDPKAGEKYKKHDYSRNNKGKGKGKKAAGDQAAQEEKPKKTGGFKKLN